MLRRLYKTLSTCESLSTHVKYGHREYIKVGYMIKNSLVLLVAKHVAMVMGNKGVDLLSQLFRDGAKVAVWTQVGNNWIWAARVLFLPTEKEHILFDCHRFSRPNDKVQVGK